MARPDLVNQSGAREFIRGSSIPAVGLLKRDGVRTQRLFNDGPRYTDVLEPESLTALQTTFADKGFYPQVIQKLADSRNLSSSVSDLIIGEHIRQQGPIHAIGDAFSQATDYSAITPSYRGTPAENALIDASIKASERKWSPRREQTGNGASRFMEPRSRVPRVPGLFTPVIIIGAGPAGIITARTFRDAGFSGITILDERGKYNGIWNQENVGSNHVSKNNPFDLSVSESIGHYLGLTAAPGPGSDVPLFLGKLAGEKATSFGDTLAGAVTHATVTAVEPGNLDHIVHFKTPNGTETTLRAPIVINTIGTGKPLHPSREGYMTTDTPESAGIRWQQVLTPEKAEKYREKTLVFIGLGNSTAEMLMQIRVLNQQGFNIDYRIITHYPEDSVRNPEKTVMKEGHEYRVYRDLSMPNLVRWEGDLPDARAAYEEALSTNKIITDIGEWNMEKGSKLFRAKRKDGTELDPIPCDQLFTLIGYGHPAETLKAMGMTVTDEYLGTIAADYDGEVQRNPGSTGRDRVYPGYFANGALLKSPTNPNAQVIPGMLFRTPDLLFTAIVRATESRNNNDGSIDEVTFI